MTRPGKFKSKFTEEEDLRLTDIVARLGSSDWSEVAQHLEGRNARQCRERWLNYVNPAIERNPWTYDEEILLEQKISELGTKWQAIAAFFPARSKNSIKNRWLACQKKKSRTTPRKEASPATIVTPPTTQPQPLPLPQVTGLKTDVQMDVRSIGTIGAFEEMTEMFSIDVKDWGDTESSYFLNF